MTIAESPGINGESTFVARAGIELKRAERYRVFVSIVVLDLKGLGKRYNGGYSSAFRRLLDMIRAQIRACDFVAHLDDNSIGLIFPETSRQGAETAGRRIGDLIRKRVEKETDGQVSELIPLEMVSYPDAAGAKTVSDFLQELATRNLN